MCICSVDSVFLMAHLLEQFMEQSAGEGYGMQKKNNLVQSCRPMI